MTKHRLEVLDAGQVFEIYTGAAYANVGLVDGLVARGARVEQPLAGLRQVERLHAYKEAGCH